MNYEPNFLKAFMELAKERQEVGIFNNASDKDQYDKHIQEADIIRDILIERLNTTGQGYDLVDKLTESYMAASSIYTDNAYMQGVRDGVILIKVLKRQ